MERDYNDIFEDTKKYLFNWMKISDMHRDAVMDLMGTERYDLLFANGSVEAFVDLDDGVFEKTKSEHYHSIKDTVTISTKIKNCLLKAGYGYWEDVVKASIDDLKEIRYLDDNSILDIIDVLEAYGINGYLFRSRDAYLQNK